MIRLCRAQFKDTLKVEVKKNDVAGLSIVLKFHCSNSKW